jgi:hypothetical protein
MSHDIFTARTEALLRALCLAVRLFSLRQISRQWWRDDKANARKALRGLEANELVSQRAVLSRTLPILEAPVATWSPGERAPDFGPIAYRLKRRWQGRAPLRTRVFVATARAIDLFGARSAGRLKNPLQAQHDLALAEVYLWFLNHRPELAAAWVGEDQIPHKRRREKLPDAYIMSPARRPLRLIEQGGGYDKRRVRAFHRYAASQNLPYELW